MLYSQAISYLESLVNLEKSPAYNYKDSVKLERVIRFLDLLDNPQNTFKCIQVAGTKGKGSTCAFISYILKEAGYKVGLYTSPHLADLRERIRILPGKEKGEFEGLIPKGDFKALVSELKPVIERYNLVSRFGPLTFFEVSTALALQYFKKRGVDLAVLETGLGGRLDATSIVSPEVCVITPISYEHVDKLGKTLTSIAREKAGIIKNNSFVVSAPQDKEAQEVIRARCKLFHSKLYEIKEESRNRIQLLGKHQKINAALAEKAVKLLRSRGIKFHNNSIVKGLFNTKWPGRCEVINKKPYVIIDGAQNSTSAKALKETIQENFTRKNKYEKLVLILGVSSDKDIKGICDEFRGLADKIILTRAESPRAASPGVLAKHFNGKDNYLTNSVREAKILAKRLVGRKDLLLVTGSLFVIGEFKYGKRKFN